MIEGLSRTEHDNERQELQRMFNDHNAWSNEGEIAEIIGHPLDVQDDLREFHDSYMIDLQPHKDAAREARIQREARQAERRRERMRERYNEHGEITKFVTVA